MENKKVSVMLINAPTFFEERYSSNYSVFPALGIVTIATQLRNYYQNNLDIKVIDGGIHPFHEILLSIKTFKPDVVGISVLTPTYPEGLKIAEFAKQIGSITVLGADHACFFPYEILEKRPYVDYVIQAEGGEMPFVYLLGKIISKIPPGIILKGGPEKIFSRENRKIIELAAFPKFSMKASYKTKKDIPDLNFVGADLDVVSDNYNKLYYAFHKSPRRPAVINNIRGCNNGIRRCIYCSIWDLSVNPGNANFFWQTVQKYNKEFGVNFLFEVCDNFFSSKSYLFELIKTRPFNPISYDIEFEVYARASELINFRKSISTLKYLNVTRVNIGLDSGDDRILIILGKGNKNVRIGKSISPSQVNYEAVKILSNAGISIHASFPLGALGETKESLNNTIKFINRIATDFPQSIASLEASEFVLLPNSPLWDKIITSRNNFNSTMNLFLKNYGIYLQPNTLEIMQEKYKGQDILNIKEIIRDWIHYFTKISSNDILNAKNEVQYISKKIGANYGNAI